MLEKRLHISFAQVDIYAKVGGGIRLMEPGMDLPLVAAVLSSYYDVPLPERAVFWGEVDLNGQIRPVAGHSLREGQASRLGYDPIISPTQSKKAHNEKTAGKGEHPRFSTQLRTFGTLKEMQRFLFSPRKA